MHQPRDADSGLRGARQCTGGHFSQELLAIWRVSSLFFLFVWVRVDGVFRRGDRGKGWSRLRERIVIRRPVRTGDQTLKWNNVGSSGPSQDVAKQEIQQMLST